MITVLTVRGTGETLGGTNNMLTYVTRRLDVNRYQIGPDIAYPASVGPVNDARNIQGPSEADSIKAGVAAVVGSVRALSGDVAILGYSLGAEVVSVLLSQIAAGEYDDIDLAWAACVANPLRREGDSIDPGSVGYGINGQHDPWPEHIPTYEAANPRDAITSCPAGSPLRAVADSVSAFTFAAHAWDDDLYDRLLDDRWQMVLWGNPLHPIQTWRTYDTAAAGVWGYLYGSQHTSMYLQRGILERLAAILNTRQD